MPNCIHPVKLLGMLGVCRIVELSTPIWRYIPRYAGEYSEPEHSGPLEAKIFQYQTQDPGSELN